MLHIILTSYNRPRHVQRAIESVIAQNDNNWLLHIMDDNSGIKTRRTISEYRQHPQVSIKWHNTTEAERRHGIRYSALINHVLDGLEVGFVGYLTDNAQWHEDTVGEVLGHFAANPRHRAAYVLLRRVGWPEKLRQPDILPTIRTEHKKPKFRLDHSQVFHRLPVRSRWPLDMEHIRWGDGVFFEDLVKEVGPIWPIRRLLAMEHWVT